MGFLLGRPLFSAVYECKKGVGIGLPICVLCHLTLLVNARRSFFHPPGGGCTRGMSLILLGFKHGALGHCSECFGINQQSLIWPSPWGGRAGGLPLELNLLLQQYRERSQFYAWEVSRVLARPRQ